MPTKLSSCLQAPLARLPTLSDPGQSVGRSVGLTFVKNKEIIVGGGTLDESHVITSSYNHLVIMRTHRWPYAPYGPCFTLFLLLVLICHLLWNFLSYTVYYLSISQRKVKQVDWDGKAASDMVFNSNYAFSECLRLSWNAVFFSRFFSVKLYYRIYIIR